MDVVQQSVRQGALPIRAIVQWSSIAEDVLNLFGCQCRPMGVCDDVTGGEADECA